MRFVMTANQMRGLVAATVIMKGAGALGRVSGQAPGPARGDDVLPALLAEVKGLRAAMEQMSSAGPRVQLFVGRLQLQETRMNGMIRRLDTVRDTLGTARRDLDRAKGGLKMLSGPPEPGVPQEDLGPMINGMKQEVAAAQATVDRLANEETQLTQDLTAEQARWLDINQRLDELERALAKR